MLFLVYVDTNIDGEKIIKHKRMPQYRVPLDRNAFAKANLPSPRPYSWVIADDAVEIEDKLLEQYSSVVDFIRVFSPAS